MTLDPRLQELIDSRPDFGRGEDEWIQFADRLRIKLEIDDAERQTLAVALHLPDSATWQDVQNAAADHRTIRDLAVRVFVATGRAPLNRDQAEVDESIRDLLEAIGLTR